MTYVGPTNLVIHQGDTEKSNYRIARPTDKLAKPETQVSIFVEFLREQSQWTIGGRVIVNHCRIIGLKQLTPNPALALKGIFLHAAPLRTIPPQGRSYSSDFYRIMPRQ